MPFPLSSNKPILAKLNEDYPKIRNIQTLDELNELINFMVRILNIKVATPEDKKDLDFQMVLALDLIRNKFGGLTVPEVKEAFKMYVSHQFDIKVFRLLDCVSIGEILNAYTEFRNESLRVYIDKKQKAADQEAKLPREEVLATMKAGIINCYMEFLETGVVDDGKFYIFQTIYQIGMLPKPEEESEEFRPIAAAYVARRELAKSQIRIELTIAKTKETDQFKREEYVAEYLKVKNDESQSVNNRAMALVLAGYFAKLKDNPKLEKPMAELERLVDENIEKYIYE